MNQILKSSLCIAMLFSSFVAADVVPYIPQRSESVHAERELVGWQQQINLFDECDTYGSFSIMLGYDRSFRPERIAQALFCDALLTDCCDSKCSTMKVQGSQVDGRDSKALLADYFGLATDFESTITLEPRVDNIFVDFNLYVGLDEWWEGGFFRIHAPVVSTRSRLNFCEKDITVGANNHPVGYFNNAVVGAQAPIYGIAQADLLQSFEDYVTNGKAPNLGSDVTFNPLTKAKWAKCPDRETKLSDIQAVLGWNFWMDECYHVGLGIRAAAPTGTRPEGCYLFEPVVGNGHHWELGAQFTSHWSVWQDDCDADAFTIYLDANITHLFKTKQCRTFDLCGKPLSRYMLAEKLGTPVEDLYAAVDPVAMPNAQFKNEFTPVANITTIPVDVSAAVQGDLALKFAYTHCNFEFDLGYNLWARSCEKICPRCDCSPFVENTWALKGDAFVYGFAQTQGEIDSALASALSATESKATIFAGTNVPADKADWYTNIAVDAKQAAVRDDAGAVPLYTSTGTLAGDAVFTSYQPIFITADDMDIQGAKTRGISNTIFGHMNYVWNDCECWTPYLGIGAEVEFGKMDDKCCCDSSSCCTTSSCSTSCTTSCNTNCCSTDCCDSSCCHDVAVSRWGVWVKGGISFN